MSAGFRLLAPDFWPVFLASAAGAWAVFRLEARRARHRRAVFGLRADLLTKEASPSRRRGRNLCAAGLLLAGGAAALQPAWGAGLPRPDEDPADIMICLDVSRSMLARDLAPDRLRRARQEIQSLAARARGDRLGLVVFAGEARLLIPLTTDMESFAQLLELAEPDVLPRGGTDLGAAISAAIRALGSADGEHEAIVLLTDGEDLAAAGAAAAAQAQARGIAIHCVGFGSARGSKIAVERDGGESFLRDGAGREVVSALDAAGLRAIADATGGLYLEAGAAPGALAQLQRERLDPLTGRARSAGAAALPAARFPLLLLCAFALGILELGWSERARR